MRRRKVRARLLAAAVTLLAALLTSSAWAAHGDPSPFRHDLRRIDSRFRMAIEYGPAELGEGLIASEAACRLGEESERRGEGDLAAADWSTLAQMVEEIDEPAAGRIDSALRRADSGLRALREKYVDAWPDPGKTRQLRQGVADSRLGIRLLREAMGTIEESFEAWKTHGCRAAKEAIESGGSDLSRGVDQVNTGMQALWELAFP